MLKLIMCSMLVMGTFVFAGTHGTNRKISGKSISIGALLLLIWSGISQEIIRDTKKVTHAILELTGFFRIWYCYGAVVDRQDGVWNNRI